MTFYTASETPRPVRLSEPTRRFAYDSLHHRYGLDTRKVPAVSLDSVEGIGAMKNLDRYDAAIRAIAEHAPIRICEGERLSGAATLGLAIDHAVPATIGGKPVCHSISHLTIDFFDVLRIGCDGIIENIRASVQTHTQPRGVRFLESALSCMESLKIWHGRYLAALKDRAEYRANYEALCRVPFAPPRSFYEAVQSVWFIFAFVRLCGNWPGIGRLDAMLGPYLQRDMASGAVTRAEAREILAHFLIKGCEWITGTSNGSGDAQHYQNLVLAGVDENGVEVTNDVTYLLLELIEELGISDFPITLRLREDSPPALLTAAAEVIRHGGGVVAVYNEDIIIESLVNYGYTLSDARRFANDGCWEVQIPGETCFSYCPFDGLEILQSVTLGGYAEGIDYPSYEALYNAFIRDLSARVGAIYRGWIGRRLEIGEDRSVAWKPQGPCTVVSVFERGCIANARSYLEGGPNHTIYSPHIGGLADIVNSLYAIRTLVYEEKRLSLPELLAILREDWAGNEALRRHAAEKYRYFGNDNDAVDAIAVQLLADFSAACRAVDGFGAVKFPAGVSTFGRQLEWAPHRFATPFGKHKATVLAGNCSPTPGTDKEGATAIIRSYCKADLRLQQSGAALDLRLMPRDVAGETGLQTLVGLIRGFLTLGGFFLQPDVADAAELRRAQADPENYPTLSVRISGWNARFVTLQKEWQDMIIAQMEKA